MTTLNKQLNFRTPPNLKQIWAKFAEKRGITLVAWLKEAAEVYGSICADADARGQSPADLLALMHSDHMVVTGLVAELEVRATREGLSEFESALLLRLDPIVWQQITGKNSRKS